MEQENILFLFHHIHHKSGEHEAHHCGGGHKKVNYKILHCTCGQHRINKKTAIGHGTDQEEIKIKFMEKCAKGGWHLESGKVISDRK